MPTGVAGPLGWVVADGYYGAWHFPLGINGGSVCPLDVVKGLALSPTKNDPTAVEAVPAASSVTAFVRFPVLWLQLKSVSVKVGPSSEGFVGSAAMPTKVSAEAGVVLAAQVAEQNWPGPLGGCRFPVQVVPPMIDPSTTGICVEPVAPVQ